MEASLIKLNCLKFGHCLYVSICISFAILASGWCISFYLQDEDVSHVSFKAFNEDDDSHYPSVILCFAFPFQENKLRNIGDNITGDLYQNFLKGEYWDDRMLSIDYDNVTMNLEDYINYIYVFNESWVGKSFVSFRSALQKCFTIDTPSPIDFPLKRRKIIYMRIHLITAVFPNETRPFGSTGRNGKNSFAITFHYPGQRTSPAFQNWRWKRQNGGAPGRFVMRFTIRSIEVIKKRNKGNQPCNTDWKGYDMTVLNHFTDKIGCKAPYWIANRTTPGCSNISHMKKAHEPFKYYTWTEFIDEIQEPCQTIETFGVTYSEDVYDHVYPNGTAKEKVFYIILRFRDMPRFKQITQVASYDFASTYGNAGGYIGIYVGWSFIQIPEFIMYVYSAIKRYINVINLNLLSIMI